MSTLSRAFIVVALFFGAAHCNAAAPQDHKSAHFLLHTDLEDQAAKELLARLEAMLGLVADYWGKRPVGQIECYVVDDRHAWAADDAAIPDVAWAKIRAGSGMTASRTTKSRAGRSGQAIVYAAAAGTVVQHEAVHAYCRQTFGEVGQPWYAEGMAEVGQCWRAGNQGVNADARVLEFLRSREPRALQEIVDPKAEPGSAEDYAWCWAVCHVMTFTPAYKDRFAAFGRSMLQGKRASFEKVFGAKLREIEFEYRFFLAHVERGYRVDLCDWDWSQRFQPIRVDKPLTATIAARRGWQPTGGLCEAGRTYAYRATGAWALASQAADSTATGDARGNGRLVGAVLADFELSAPFELGEQGTFVAPAAGKLYLRCRDSWNELADNRGEVSVELSAAPAP